jgi:RHH-type proline utilization regulon transcriptional repressor/proline dehydrogenase/delta 1-pyrroline-5-carboxylate dehydrogenase
MSTTKSALGIHETTRIAFESEVQRLGQQLLSNAAQHRPTLYRGINGALLAHCMRTPALAAALFRFVDTLPQLTRHAAPGRQIADHLRAYLDEAEAKGIVAGLLRLAARPAFAGLARRQVKQLSRQLLAEESAAGLAAVLERLDAIPARATVDAVGEAVLSEAEADAYLQRNLRLLDYLRQRSPAQPPHLSLKLTALTPHFDPLDLVGTRRRVFARIEPLLAVAADCGATITVDMEHYELKPLILRLFLDLLDAFPDSRWRPALALQAYLPDSDGDLDTVLKAAQRHGRRLEVRLVKGAYWDQEAAWASQRSWPQPTYQEKEHTDWHYERLTARLLSNTDSLYPAIAGHNPRSLAVALAHARCRGLDKQEWEVQMLLGMGEPLRDALAEAGVALRIYVPTGDSEIGIAYLIRRLLENTASTSILRQTYIEGAELEMLLDAPQRPHAHLLDNASPVASGKAETPANTPFTNLPLLDFSQSSQQQAFAAALAEVRRQLPQQYKLKLPGVSAPPVAIHQARNPARPAELLGTVELAGPAHADTAIALARFGFPAWAGAPVAQRVAILRRAAELMNNERRHLAALAVLEVGKNWREADADVAEAIDFLRYYAEQMEGLGGWRPTHHFPGEDNRVSYAPRGVAVVIAPWNFPLALLAGMTSAALVAGNTVIMKPALPALLIAHHFLRLLRQAGVPQDACQLLPGDAELGARLVADPRVHLIAFTGSRAVGLDILRSAHTPRGEQRHVKQVVCEMGGKNAIIVDDDADLDEAVAGIVASAFGYGGQKCSACSRVIAVGSVHDLLLERLAAAAAALPWGAPEDPAFTHGPLINSVAQQKAYDYIGLGRREGRLVWQGKVPEQGWFVPPTIFADIDPQHRLAREEIFGPVLAVLRAADFDSALQLANDSDYALTGGVYSRLPTHLADARHSYRVGNLYLNRKITGARVGVQPFGGVALSGTGIPAGGPDYLKQFLWSRCISENTMRHGFIPHE